MIKGAPGFRSADENLGLAKGLVSEMKGIQRGL